MKTLCDRKKADQYLLGQMEAKQEQAFRFHLCQCPSCRQYIEDAQRLTHELLIEKEDEFSVADENTDKIPPLYLRFRKIVFPVVSAAAAAIVLALLIFYPQETDTVTGQKDELHREDSIYQEALTPQIEKDEKASSADYSSESQESHEN